MQRFIRARRGGSLVEVLIAVVVVSIVLVGVLSAGTIARLSVDHNARGKARDVALRVLDWSETVPLSADFGDAFSKAFGATPEDRTFGDITFTAVRDPNTAGTDTFQATVTVSVSSVSETDKKTTQSMTREVSSIGYKNAGELQ